MNRSGTGASKTLAETQFSGQTELSWFEWGAAASAWLTNLALLAHSADSGFSTDQAQEVSDAYLPWISLAATMLDSYCDVAEDAASGGQSMVSLDTTWARPPIGSSRFWTDPCRRQLLSIEANNIS